MLVKQRAIVGIACAALLGAACGGNVSVQGSSGPLTAAIAAEPDMLDPNIGALYVDDEVLENVYDTLVEPDLKDNMGPALATSWTTSSDGLTWTFNLRTTKWQDGTDFTADDVVYTYRRIIDQKLVGSSKLTSVQSVTSQGPQKVVIQLEQPDANLLTEIGGIKETAIVEKSNVESGQIKEHPIGTGPYRFVSWEHGSAITLAPNPTYWAGKPKPSSLKFIFVSDPTVALQNLRGGEVQWTDSITAQQASSLGSGGGLTVANIPGTGYVYFTVNQSREPYGNKLVRQAIAYAIDRNAIVKAAHFQPLGNGTVNQTAIPRSSYWYYDYAPYTYDPAKAKSLLAQAGVHGLTMDVIEPSQYPFEVTIAQVLASEFKDVGITLNLRTLDTGTFLTQYENGQYDGVASGFVSSISPPDFYYSAHHCGGPFNWQHYCNKSVDQLLEKAAQTSDPANRRSLYDQAVKIVVDEASFIYLYNINTLQAYSSKVHGYTPRPDDAVRFRDAWLSGGSA